MSCLCPVQKSLSTSFNSVDSRPFPLLSDCSHNSLPLPGASLDDARAIAGPVGQQKRQECGLVSSSIDSIYWKVEKESPTTEAWLDCAVDWSVESWKSNSFEQTYFWSGCLVFSGALDFVVWILWHNLVCNPSRLPSSASYACNSSFFPPRGHWRPLHWTNWHDPCLQKANALEPAVRCDNECTTLGMQETRILQDVMHSTSCSRSFTT